MELTPYREVKKRQSVIRCRDGHYVKSRVEKAVDDFLFSHGVLHEVYPHVPYSHFTADFKVGDVFIEVWGLKGMKDYDEEMERKIEHYKKYSLRMIGIEPGQNIASKLRELIPQRKLVDLDIYERASKDKRIEEIDKEIDMLNEKIRELCLRRNQIIDENVKAALSSSPS
jgi:hypothetical protein